MLGNQMKILVAEMKRQILFCLTMTAGCGAVMSAKGASVESWLSVGITQKDLQSAADASANVPELTGILPLASEQNMWLSFRYAAVGIAAGFVITVIIVALYCRFKDTKLISGIRRWCRQE